jgi:hypothetical protein
MRYIPMLMTEAEVLARPGRRFIIHSTLPYLHVPTYLTSHLIIHLTSPHLTVLSTSSNWRLGIAPAAMRRIPSSL